MSSSPSVKKLALYGLISSVILVSGHNALAHTEMQSQTLEGVEADNALKIGHGCEALKKPVIAQSVVFPTVNPVLTASNGRIVSNLGDVISPGSLAGLVDGIQNKNIFAVQGERYDAKGNVIGFYGKKGNLATFLQGRVPFVFTAPTFVATSCAKKLRIQVAVADICLTSKPTIKKANVNLWIPDNSSQYATLGTAAGVDGIGDPPALLVNRDLINNPLNASCGAGFDVTVTPSAEDVDANLGIPGFWSK